MAIGKSSSMAANMLEGLSFGNASPESVNNVNDKVNDVHNISLLDISMIDTYEKNEELFGYNNLSSVENSIRHTGVEGVEIHVYEKADGRFLCYSGNTRLLALKNMGEKQIRCIIDGPVPDADQLALNVISMNTQRTDDAYHVAKRLTEIESILRRRGLVGDKLVSEIESISGYKRAAQFEYKKISSLPENLQLLFNNLSVPYRKLLKVIEKLPKDKHNEFAYAFNQFAETEEMNGDNIERLFLSIMNNPKESTKSQSKSTFTNNVLIKSYKEFLKVKYNEDGNILVDQKNKDQIIAEANEIIAMANKVIEAYS